MSHWVWRHDGTLQCELGAEEPLEEAEAQLAAIIGAEAIVDRGKRNLPVPVPALCGAPTGQVNTFKLTADGYCRLFTGVPGAIGFAPWPDPDPDAGATPAGPLPFGALAAADLLGGRDVAIVRSGPDARAPALGDLYGRPCRVYRLGDALTKDRVPGRANIGLTGDGRIAELWFG